MYSVYYFYVSNSGGDNYVVIVMSATATRVRVYVYGGGYTEIPLKELPPPKFICKKNHHLCSNSMCRLMTE